MIASSDDETIAPSRSWNSFGGPGMTTTVLIAARIGESMSDGDAIAPCSSRPDHARKRRESLQRHRSRHQARRAGLKAMQVMDR